MHCVAEELLIANIIYWTLHVIILFCSPIYKSNKPLEDAHHFSMGKVVLETLLCVIPDNAYIRDKIIGTHAFKSLIALMPWSKSINQWIFLLHGFETTYKYHLVQMILLSIQEYLCTINVLPFSDCLITVNHHINILSHLHFPILYVCGWF